MFIKQYNKYNLENEFGIGYTLKGQEFYFDLEDYDKIKDYCWHINDSGYLTSTKKTIRIHRLVMNCNKNEEIDHVNHNLLDNRKYNLRIVTSSQNKINRKKVSYNTSGHKGVSWDKDRNKWAVYIGLNNKLIHLGRFNNIDDAIKIRKEAEKKYFGEYNYKGE